MISNILKNPVVLIILVVLLFSYISSRRKRNVITAAERQQMEDQQRIRRIQEEERRHQEEAKQREIEKPTVTFPEKVNNFNRVYFYPDVKIVPVPDGAAHVVVGEPLIFNIDDDPVSIFQGDYCIGHMVENRLAEMVRTWVNSEEPILAYVAEYSENGSSAMIGLAFYQDKLAKFLARNPDAKVYKLAGKPDEDYLGVSAGDICTVEHDDEHDRYNVISYGSVIGRLPASALTFAENQECDPEDLTVIVASCEYDFDKDRDVISVYLDD